MRCSANGRGVDINIGVDVISCRYEMLRQMGGGLILTLVCMSYHVGMRRFAKGRRAGINIGVC